MRAKTILALCCFLTLLLSGAVLSAEPAPALANPVLDSGATAPVCSAAPVAQTQRPTFALGPVPNSPCPPSVWQACYKRYGTCTLCFCIGSGCECENRCV